MNYSFYDEMDELNEILTETTDEEAFLETMMDLLGFNDPKYGVYTEKSHIQRALDRFKKRYEYDPSTSTIKVDGTRYKVDMDINNDYICVKVNGRNIWKIRDTSVDPNDGGTIILDKDFFKLKNGRRRNATLQHEIGHARLHTTTIPDDDEDDKPIPDKTKLSRGVLKYSALKSAKNIYDDQIKHGKSHEEANKTAQKEAKKILQNSNSKRYMAKQVEYASKDDINEREATFKRADHLARKLRGTRENPHLNPLEIEADRYAANKSNEREVKRGLRENSKRKSTDKAIHDLNKKMYNTKMMNAVNFDPKEKFSATIKHPTKSKTLSSKLQRKVSDIEDRAQSQYDIEARLMANNVKNVKKQDPQNVDANKDKDKTKYARKINNHEIDARTKALKDPDMRNSKSLK